MNKPTEKSRLRSVSRWVVLCASIILAALYLNSAFYSAWVSGGPPTPYPEAWAQRALVHLCLSGAILFGGIAAFRAIGNFPSFGGTTILFGVLALLVLGVPHVRAFLKTDACLDSGGRWNSAEFRCDK